MFLFLLHRFEEFLASVGLPSSSFSSCVILNTFHNKDNSVADARLFCLVPWRAMVCVYGELDKLCVKFVMAFS